MEEFIKKYGGYIIGFLLAPITWHIFKALKSTFKSTINKENPEKYSDK